MISIFKRPVCAHFPSVETLNRDVTPKAIHSHNDYWRKRPLLDALSFGCISVEADIWKFPTTYTVTDTYTQSTSKFLERELYVGHNQMHLEEDGTLEKMYLEPLQAFLESSNKQFKGKGEEPVVVGRNFVHGVFYDDPEQSLDFWLDIKTGANDTYRFLETQLQPLIDKGYLTWYSESEGVVKRPITITLTGNVPWALIRAEAAVKRYVFLDCPLYDFEQASEETLEEYRKLCRYASTSYEREIKDGRRPGDSGSEKPVERAHGMGIKARIWGGPEWPRHVQTQYWNELLAAGYDLINTDHIAYAASQY